MNKFQVRHWWVMYGKRLPLFFLTVAVLSGMLCAFALRSNNVHMIKLRDEVYQADKSGNGLDQSLTNLRVYVYAHMNTDLSGGPDAVYPPLQLKYTYDRLVQAEGARVQAANSQIYTDAQQYCEQLYPGSFSGGPRVPCITNYVNTHGTKSQPIPDGLYKFDFISPRWSPDLAGWSLVVALVSLVLAGISFVFSRWFHRRKERAR